MIKKTEMIVSMVLQIRGSGQRIGWGFHRSGGRGMVGGVDL